MRRDEALRILRELKPTLAEKYGVTRIGVFGSVARDEAGADSDVDVLVEMEPVGLWEMTGLWQDLEEALSSSVDLVRYREDLRPLMKSRINRDTVYA